MLVSLTLLKSRAKPPSHVFRSIPNRTCRRSVSFVQKLGLGGHKWSRMDPERYSQVLQTAVDHGITFLEAGQEGGDVALSNALKTLSTLVPPELTILTRIGYRTLHPSKTDKEHLHLTQRWDGDVTVEKQTTENGDEVEIIHNLTPTYLQHELDKLVMMNTKVVVPMIHNPEVQINHEHENPQDGLYEKLKSAFVGMEEAVGQGEIHQFGVASNGLSLPEQHPLYLNYQVVLQAANDAANKVHGNAEPSLTMLELPANIMEKRGVQVARDIVDSAHTWPRLQVVCMRPLTWYPQDSGTAANRQPISFVDYQIPTKEGVVFTNEMEGPPLVYQQALNNALSHFDGTALLEEKKERKLTTEERETLEGCKLLQSILHDLDVGLEKVSSFAAYEHDLYDKVIPTLYGRFEELDEESSLVLQVRFICCIPR